MLQNQDKIARNNNSVDVNLSSTVMQMIADTRKTHAIDYKQYDIPISAK